MFKFKKKKKANESIYLSYDEFKKLAQKRHIDKNEQFLVNYYKQLSNTRGVNEKEASHALNCIVINNADEKARALLGHPHAMKNSSSQDHQSSQNATQSRSMDITEDKYLDAFIEYIGNKQCIHSIFLKISPSSPKHPHLDMQSVGAYLYELIFQFFRQKCLCKRHEIPSYNMVLTFINCIKDQLSYFNDNRHIFSFSFLAEYLPITVNKFRRNKNDIKRENKLQEMDQLMERMYHIDDTINEYQNDIADIIDDLKMRTNKMRSNTYPERIDDLNTMLNDLRKQIEIFASELTKLENEQLSAERAAEDLRNSTLQKFGALEIDHQNAFNINQHIHSVMDQNIDNILAANDVGERRASCSKSKSKSQSKSNSKSKSHTINSEMASTSIRKPFFVRPLGFEVELNAEQNELLVTDVVLDSQAYKLKVCRGWSVIMVGREDRVSVMHKILCDANQQSNDDANALPLFITFKISSF